MIVSVMEKVICNNYLKKIIFSRWNSAMQKLPLADILVTKEIVKETNLIQPIKFGSLFRSRSKLKSPFSQKNFLFYFICFKDSRS